MERDAADRADERSVAVGALAVHAAVQPFRDDAPLDRHVVDRAAGRQRLVHRPRRRDMIDRARGGCRRPHSARRLRVPPRSPGRKRRWRTMTSCVRMTTSLPRMHTPSPGAPWPSRVRNGDVITTGESSVMSPAIENSTILGPSAVTAARKLPGPESASVVTAIRRPPRPPGVPAPKPSAAAGGAGAEAAWVRASKVVIPKSAAIAFMAADYAIATNHLTLNSVLGFPVQRHQRKWTVHLPRPGWCPWEVIPHDALLFYRAPGPRDPGGPAAAGGGPGLPRRHPWHGRRHHRRRAAGRHRDRDQHRHRRRADRRHRRQRTVRGPLPEQRHLHGQGGALRLQGRSSAAGNEVRVGDVLQRRAQPVEPAASKRRCRSPRTRRSSTRPPASAARRSTPSRSPSCRSATAPPTCSRAWRPASSIRPTSISRVRPTTATSAGIVANGVQGGNEFTIDGAPNMSNARGVGFSPPSDAIAEFKVQTNAFDAQTGHTAGAVVNLALKSGTNALHARRRLFQPQRPAARRRRC